MGGKCSPSGTIIPIGGIFTVHGRKLEDDECVPNSRYDLYKRGNHVQSRWYDGEGKAEWDRDYFHPDRLNNHTFPHDHSWVWKKSEGEGKDIGDRSLPVDVKYVPYC